MEAERSLVAVTHVGGAGRNARARCSGTSSVLVWQFQEQEETSNLYIEYSLNFFTNIVEVLNDAYFRSQLNGPPSCTKNNQLVYIRHFSRPM